MLYEVITIDHIEVARLVGGDTLGPGELSQMPTRRTPGTNRLSLLVDGLHTEVAPVGDVEMIVGTQGDIPRQIEFALSYNFV